LFRATKLPNQGIDPLQVLKKKIKIKIKKIKKTKLREKKHKERIKIERNKVKRKKKDTTKRNKLPLRIEPRAFAAIARTSGIGSTRTYFKNKRINKHK